MPDGSDTDEEEGLSRRDLLKTTGAVAASSMLPGSVARGERESSVFSLEDLSYQLAFLNRVDWRNASMVQHGIDHITDASWEDLEYNWDHFAAKMATLGRGLISGNGMNDFQKHSASEGYLSTPDDGIGAGVTENGRLSSLFFPHTGFTTHLPYFSHGEGDLDGAKPREGSFAGVHIGEETSWLWDDQFRPDDDTFSYRDGAGMLDIGYENDQLSIDETTYVLPGEGTLVRDYEIENTGDEPIDGSFLYHTQANVNDGQQNFILWSSNQNTLTVDETLHWNDKEGPYELEIGMDEDVTDATITAPFEDVIDELIDLPIGERIVEYLATTAAELTGTDDEFVAVDKDEIDGIYLGGMLETDLDLEPGETDTVSVFLAGGEDPELPDTDDMHERQALAEQYWSQWNEEIDVPDGMTDEEQFRYEQAVRTLGMMHDAETGAVPAAPNIQPMYYPSWIRDASFTSVAMTQAGKDELAKEYLAGFLPTVQEDDGSFKQCYDSEGGFAGIFEIENDQQPIFAWAVHEVYEETGDDQFLEEAWPTVRDALDYTVDSIVDNGLLAATPDYAEMPIDIRQSMFANAFAYRALKDGARMAEELGEDGEKYEEAAETIGDAAYREFIEEPDNGIYTQLTITGGSNNATSIDSPAIWPTEWARDYEVTDQLIGEFTEPTEDCDDEDSIFWDEQLHTDCDNEYKKGWLPGHLTKAAMMYNEGRDELGDQYVADAMAHQNDAGDFVETVEDDEYYFASPLGWSQAAFLLAMDEKYAN